MQATGREEARPAQPTRWAFGPAILVALMALAPGVAQGAPRAEMTLRFGAQKPGAVTSMHLGVLYRGAGEPDAKPSPIRSAMIETPAGTRLESTSIPPCSAGDEELTARGATPVPPRAGWRRDVDRDHGLRAAVRSLPHPRRPVSRRRKVWVEVVQRPGTSVGLGADRARIMGSTVVLSPAAAPVGRRTGTRPSATIDLDFPATGFVVTPAACPGDGLWRTRGGSPSRTA